MSHRRIKRPTEQRPDAARMEVFSMRRQLADMWEKTGELWLKFSVARQEDRPLAMNAFKAAAESLQTATNMLEMEVREKEDGIPPKDEKEEENDE